MNGDPVRRIFDAQGLPGLHGVAVVEIGQRLALHKGKAPVCLQACRDRHADKAGAVSERIAADACHPLRDRQALQGPAAIEGPDGDARHPRRDAVGALGLSRGIEHQACCAFVEQHAVRRLVICVALIHSNIRQSFAAGEDIGADSDIAIRHCDAAQFAAISKSIIPNVECRLWKHDLCQFCAKERITPDMRHSPRHFYSLHCKVAKGILSNHSDALFDHDTVDDRTSFVPAGTGFSTEVPHLCSAAKLQDPLGEFPGHRIAAGTGGRVVQRGLFQRLVAASDPDVGPVLLRAAVIHSFHRCAAGERIFSDLLQAGRNPHSCERGAARKGTIANGGESLGQVHAQDPLCIFLPGRTVPHCSGAEQAQRTVFFQDPAQILSA